MGEADGTYTDHRVDGRHPREKDKQEGVGSAALRRCLPEMGSANIKSLASNENAIALVMSIWSQ